MWVGVHNKTQANVLCARDKKGQRINECLWFTGEGEEGARDCDGAAGVDDDEGCVYISGEPYKTSR